MGIGLLLLERSREHILSGSCVLNIQPSHLATTRRI